MKKKLTLVEWSIDTRDKALQEIGNIIGCLAEVKDSEFYSERERIFLENKMNEINNYFFGDNNGN